MMRSLWLIKLQGKIPAADCDEHAPCVKDLASLQADGRVLIGLLHDSGACFKTTAGDFVDVRTTLSAVLCFKRRVGPFCRNQLHGYPCFPTLSSSPDPHGAFLNTLKTIYSPPPDFEPKLLILLWAYCFGHTMTLLTMPVRG